MGFTIYLTLPPTGIRPDAWQRFVRKTRRLYRELWTRRGLRLTAFNPEDYDAPPLGCMVPVARKDVVYFTGASPRESCEAFVLEASSRGWSCWKTRALPYDFAVRCALVLLIEAMDAIDAAQTQVSCDGYSLRGWWKAVDWLGEAGLVRGGARRATAAVLASFEGFETYRENLHSSLDRGCGAQLAWLLSRDRVAPDGGLPEEDRIAFARIILAAKRVARALRKRLAQRRERASLWVPRLVGMLVSMA